MRSRRPIDLVGARRARGHWSLSRNDFDLGDIYTTAIWIPFGGDAPGGRMRTNHSTATRAHRVSRALSSMKNPMNSAEPRNHDRILWLGLLALLLAAACGTSANPGPGTPDPIRTYRIRRLADSPVGAKRARGDGPGRRQCAGDGGQLGPRPSTCPIRVGPTPFDP